MKVYDVARNLVSEIQATQEYKDMVHYQIELENNTEIKSLLLEFSNEQMLLNAKHMQGQEVTQDDIMKVDNKFQELKKYDLANQFFDAQMKYTNMMNEVSKIINGE